MPVMSQLGYAQLKFVQGPPTDSSHLTLAGQYRHSSVIIRINKSPNTARLAFQDIAHHDAYFLLKCSSEFGAVFTQTPVQTDERECIAGRCAPFETTVGGALLNIKHIARGLFNDERVFSRSAGQPGSSKDAMA